MRFASVALGHLPEGKPISARNDQALLVIMAPTVFDKICITFQRKLQVNIHELK